MQEKILIVDDEYTTVTALEELLSSKGYNVVGLCMSGDEAVETATRLKPDLILMDIVMPGRIDGIAAAEIVRERLGIPVVFLTGHAEDKLVDKAKKAGPLGYIMKPFNDAQIEAAVKIALDKNEKDRQLKTANEDLEKMVGERTKELLMANKTMQEEIIQRKYAWEKLKQKEEELMIKTSQLDETNTALKVLLKRRQIDNEEIEEKVVSNVNALIKPYLKKLRKTNLTPTQEIFLNILQSNTEDILSPFLRNMAARHLGLTPKEIEVGNLVKEGKNTKEIAELLNTTKRAVEFHRQSLRGKLGIRNRKANLRSYLISLP
jgi:DNA-binding NarL/FixJ family response regulator